MLNVTESQHIVGKNPQNRYAIYGLQRLKSTFKKICGWTDLLRNEEKALRNVDFYLAYEVGNRETTQFGNFFALFFHF